MSSPSQRLYAMGDRMREQPQTDATKLSVLTYFLEKSELRNSEHNRKILQRAMGDRYYTSDTLREVANQNERNLEHRTKASRPLGRSVTTEELTDWFKQIAAASPWLALTARNLDLCTRIFLTDERIPLTHNLADLVLAVEIADREHRLDKTPPPKPTFPDNDLSVPLADGSMPLPLDATTYEQRRATIAQQRNLVARLHKFEAWQREQRRSD